jgi:hypothetical protein
MVTAGCRAYSHDLARRDEHVLFGVGAACRIYETAVLDVDFHKIGFKFQVSSCCFAVRDSRRHGCQNLKPETQTET